MSSATLATPPPAAPARSGGRIVAIIGGALLALVATMFLLLGGALVWAHATQRDADGWYTSPWHRFDTPTRALTAEELRLGDVRGGPQDWLADLFSVRARVRATDGARSSSGSHPRRASTRSCAVSPTPRCSSFAGVATAASIAPALAPRFRRPPPGSGPPRPAAPAHRPPAGTPRPEGGRS